MVAEGVHRREENRVSHQDLFSTLGMEVQSEERPQQIACYRDGDELEGLGIEKRKLKFTYLFCWPTCFSGMLGWRVPRESLLKLFFSWDN